jgi:ubiquinone/menaquinone biosynthesis C-methylase UbiE
MGRYLLARVQISGAALFNMADGIIKGKYAYNYDKYSYSPKKSNQYNSFLNRNVNSNKIVVDICCGTGVSISFLKDRSKKIYGIDASQDMLNICKNRFSEKNVFLITSTANNIPLADSSCDYVLIRMGLHHIKNKLEVINEAYRLLKKNGSLLVMDKFSRYPILITFFYDIIRNLLKGYSIFGHHYISLNNFKKMIQDKFKIKEEYSHKKGVYLKANISLIKN